MGAAMRLTEHERERLLITPTARRAVYFRIKQAGHDPRWREFLQDTWLDYDAVRERLE